MLSEDSVFEEYGDDAGLRGGNRESPSRLLDLTGGEGGRSSLESMVLALRPVLRRLREPRLDISFIIS
jgi:hypothetical protein